MTQIIGSHNTGVLDGSLNLLARSDATNNGSLSEGVASLVNIANGNLVYQERDAFLPSLGPDFDLVRSYNSRGVIPGTFDGWSYSVAVKLETHNDFLAGGKTQRNFTVTYGDQSVLHFDFDAAGNRWVSTDGSGAYEVLTELSGGGATGAAYLVVREDQSQYRFDRQGSLLSVTDPNGVTMSFTYQGGKLRTVQDDSGHTITFVQAGTQLERITKTSATDASVVTLVSFGYTQSQLTSVTDRMGHVTRYSYDTNGMLVGVSLPFQQTVNGVAQNWEQRNLAFTYERFNWDDKPHLITPFDQGYTYILKSMTDALGGVTTFDYNFQFAGAMVAPDRDLAYKPNGAREFIGGSTRVVDALGNARATSNAAEFVAWRTANGFYATYSAASPQAQVDAIRNAQSVVYSFDPNSQITQVVDQLGYKTSYAYDALGNLASSTDRNGFAAIARDDQSAGDGYYQKLRFELGFADQPISFFTAQPNWATLQAQVLAKFTTSYAYDARGNRVLTTDGAGNRWTATFTPFNKVASTTSAVGNALAELDTPEVRAKRIELGYAGSLASLSANDKAALRALHTTTYAYDAKQNLTRRTDAGGDVTNFSYDANGNLTRREVVVPTINGNAAQTQVTTYAYDAYGNVRQVTDGEGFASLQTFDTFGNLVSSTDARGGVTINTYDADNRLLTERTPEGRATANAYDAVGNRVAVTDFAGKTLTQIYDRNNMLLAVIDPALSNTAAANRSTTFQYDILGNRTRATDAEGRVTSYRYDARRLVVDVTSPQVLKGDGSMGSYLTSYAYDGENNVITLVDANGNTTQTLFDSIGLTRRVTDPIGNVTEFRHDANRMQVQVVVGAQLPLPLRRVLNYSYDEEDQLVAVTDAMGGVARTLFDAAGNVVAETDQNGNQSRFEFDRNNRLVREILPPDEAGVRHTVLHGFDGNGNETNTTDANGNVTSTYFDRDDRRVMVTDGNGVNTVFEYDTRSNTTRVILGAAASFNATTAKVVLGDTTQAQVETFAYDEFNQLTAHTDGTGWALANADSAAAQAMRVELGKPASAAAVSAGDKAAFLSQYTERYAYDKVGNRLTETDHLGRITSYVYDAFDRLQSRTDAVGTAPARTVSMRYDGNGNQVRTVDAKGRVASYVFDAVDQIVQSTDALGVVTAFSYDAVGNKLSETLAAGTPDARTTSYLYDLNDRRLSETDPLGHTTAYAYDAVGNRVKVTDAKGGQTQYVYDARNRNIRVLDAMGFTTRTVYDGVGNQIQLIDAKGGVRALAYDAGNRYVQTTDAEGRITRFAYDMLDNVVRITTAFGLPEAEVTNFVYDAEGNLRQTTDAAGNVAKLGYDAVYNVTRSVDGNGNATSTEFDVLNRQIRITNALGGTTSYAYDAVDNVLTETDELGRVRSFAYDVGDRQISQTDALGVVTTYAYDRVGNQVLITEAVGLPTQRSNQFFFDKDDKLTRQVDALGGQTLYEYDANHNVTQVTDAKGQATRYAYDANDRVTTITDALNGVTSYGYDGNGNRTTVGDQNNHTTTYEFNRNNEIVKTTDPVGGVSTRAYDGNGNQVRVTDQNGHTTTYGYDALNRVVRQTNPLDAPGAGNFRTFAYDAVGNLLAATDENGRVTRFAYDALERLVTRTDAAGGVQTFSYNDVGNRVSETDERGATTTYAFDRLNRQTQRTNALLGVRSTTYDAVGNVVSETDEKGLTTTSSFDALGRLLVQIDALNHTRVQSYDAVGNVLTQTDENGNTIAFAYDANSRVTLQTNPIGSIGFGYDAVGNRTRVNDATGNSTFYAFDANDRLVRKTDALGGTYQYAYDGVGNKIRETDENNHQAIYEYDANDRLVKITDGEGYTSTMLYDAAGNAVQRTQALDLGNSNKRAVTVEQFDALKRTTATLTADGRLIQYRYDANGNVVAKIEFDQQYTAPAAAPAPGDTGRTTLYAYDSLNRLVRETSPLGIVTTYSYDALGNRTARTVAAGSGQARGTTYTYDSANRVTSQTDAMGTVTTYELDARGNVLVERAAFGTAQLRVTSWAYDANDRAVSQTDAEGVLTSFTYNAAGDMLTRVRALRTESFEYDANHRVTAAVNGAGERTEYRYDGAGNRTEIRAGITNGQAPLRVLRFEYDPSDHLTAEIDGVGVRTEHRYDGAGNRIETIQNAGGLAAAQRHSFFAYDGDNRLITVTNAEGGITRYGYDSAGNRSQITLPDGSVTRNTFDRNGRITVNIVDANGPRGGIKTVNAYDEFGNVLSTSVSFADGSDLRTTSYRYDALDRQTLVTDAEGFSTSFAYDAFGNQTQIITGQYLLQVGEVGFDAAKAARARASRIDFSYDKLDRLTDTKQFTDNASGAGDTIHASYDAFGNRLTQTTGFGAAGARTQTFSYDAANRLLRQDSAAGGVLKLEYDAAGNQTAQRQLQSGVEGQLSAVWIETSFVLDGNGVVVEERQVLDGTTTVRTLHRHDAFGNEVETVRAAGSADERRTLYTYDRNNDLVQTTEAAGTPEARITRFVVNGAGLRTKESDALNRVTRLYYDGAGRHVGTLDPQGYYTRFVRDAADNIVQNRVYLNAYLDVTPGQYDSTPPVPAAADPVQLVTNTFDRVDNLVEQVLPDGNRMTYKFDANRKLVRQTNFGSSDAARIALTANASTPLTLQFSYDDALRLTSFVNADGVVEAYAYDSANNKVRESLSNPALLAAGRSDPVRTTVFSYDADNRMVEQRFDPSGLNQVERLVYDKAGNVVRKVDSRGNATASSYDRLNRQVAVVDALGGVIRYGYDLVGNQVSLTDALGFVTEMRFNDLDQMVEKRLPAVRQYTIDGGLVSSARPTELTRYDAVGNVVQEVDANGNITTRWFDGNNNPVAELDGNLVLRTGTFDANGNSTSSTVYMTKLSAASAHNPAVPPSPPSGDSRTTRLEYDAGNRVVRTILPAITVAALANPAADDQPVESSSLVTPVTTDSFDRFGNLVTSLDGAGRRVWGWYDVRGRQVAAVDAAGYLVESSYDDQGNIVQQRKYTTALNVGSLSPATRPTPPAGSPVAVVDRIYNAANKLVEEISAEAQIGNALERVRTTYRYDEASNQIQRTLAAGTAEAQSEYMWYDALGRKVAIVNATRTLHRLLYDASGNQTSQQRFYNTVSTGVDLATATLTQVLDSVSADPANDQRTDFSFDALNRLTAQTQFVSGAGYTSSTNSIEYDPAGNETRKTDGDGFITQAAFDARGSAVRTITPNGVTSFVEYDALGLKLRDWTGVLGANAAQAATAVSAAIKGELVFSWLQGGNGLDSSFVVYDSVSRADTLLTTAAPDAVYAKRSGSAGTGAVFSSVPLAQFGAGETVYFRVVSVDDAGSQAWTEERQLVVPARATSLSSAQSGPNLVLTVTFNGAVLSPQLLYGGGAALGASTSFSNVSGNTWTVSIPQAQAGFYALRWSYGGDTLETAAAPFTGTGPHQFDEASGAAQWTLPRTLAALQTNPGQVILVDGVRLNKPEVPQYTFDGTIHFTPEFPPSNSSRTLNVFYGNEVVTAHNAQFSSTDFQYHTTTTAGTGATATRTYTYFHNYRTDIAVTLDVSEAAQVGSLQVAYRAANSGVDFTGTTGFNRSANNFNGAINLLPGVYDLKVFYTDTSGREVIVEWRRITVGAAALPANFTTLQSAPLVGQPPAVSVGSLTVSGNSVQVLARETGGLINKTGANVSITAGAYAGPLSANAAGFALGVNSTPTSQGGQRTANGLSLETYFTEIEYNAAGHVIGSNEEDGLWRRYGVDAMGNKLVTRLFGTKAAEIAFNAGDASMAPIITYSVFDSRDKEVVRFGAAVTVEGSAGLRRQVTRMSWDYAGKLATQLDPAAGAWLRVNTYDLAGNLVSETNALGQLTSYRYDRLAHRVSVTDPLNNVKRREYDQAGRMTGEVDALGNRTSYLYDAFDRQVVRIEPAAAVGGFGATTSYSYDQRDRLVEVRNAIGQFMRYSYDRRNNRVGEVDTANRATRTLFDAMGRVNEVETSSSVVPGGPVQSLLTRYSFDAYGNRSSETDEEGRRRYMSYGGSGRMRTVTDEGGRITRFTYDRFGRQVRETSDIGKDIVRVYNAAHWLTSVTDQGIATAGTRTTTTYDIGGQRKHELVTTTTGGNVTQRDISYTHDGMGRMTRWADTVTGLDLNYVWDGAGRQARVYSDNGSTNHNYSYDAADRVTSISEDGVSASFYVYDAAGRRTGQTTAGVSFTYTYNGLNRVTSARDTAGRTRATWLYDSAGNVTDYREFKEDGTTLRRTVNTYYENGLTKTAQTIVPVKISDDEPKKDSTTTNHYDRSGRMVKQVVADATDPAKVTTYTYSFSYTADGRTTSVSVTGPKDASGNSTSTYNVNDQLVQLDKGKPDGGEGNDILTFKHDNDGHVVWRRHDDGENDTTTIPVTRFVYAGGNPVGETGTDNKNATVTLLDENGKSGDEQEMQYRQVQNIGKEHPASTGSTYTAQGGDTLRKIAEATYGNASLWFLIADANGLTGDSPIKAGQQLRIPTSIESGKLTADSHVLYKESDIVGSKLPNIQTNSSSNICAIIGAIIGLIFFAIVAVVLSIVSFGALAAPLFAALVPTIGTVGALLVTVAVTGVIGAVIGAVISAINQGILIAAGLQESFDWTQFGADVVMGFIGGVTGGLSALSAAGKIATAVAKVATVVAEIALDSAGEVARQAISNNGRIDNPWTIIAAGAGAGFGAVASKAVRVQSQTNGKLSGLLTRKIVSIKPGFKGAGSALEAAQAARQVVPTKAQNVLVKGLKAGALDNLAEGTTVFKSGTTKFVRSVGPDGAPILKQVERTAVKAGKEVSLGHKLTGAFQDFKLVRVGDEVLRVPRMSAGKTVLQRVGASIRNFGKSAAEAVKSVPKQVKAAFAEQRAVDQAAKLAKPKTLTKAEVAVAYSDAPKAVQGQRGFTSVQRNKSLVDKGYTTLAKSDTDSLGNRIARKFGRGVQTNTLPAGTKLVKVGDEVQVWRRVSAQYTVGQRLNRKLAATSLGSTPVIKRLFDNFRLDAPLSKTAAGDKAVRSGFRRVFDVSTDSFQEITATTVKRRLTAEGTNLLANKANFVKAKLLDAKDSIIDALPLSKSKLLQTVVKVGTSVTLLSLRDYDNFSYFIPYTSTIGKTLALAALKEPRATFNNWLLNQSLSGFATPDKPLANAAVKGIRSSLYGLEQRWHQWLPFDWVATGANVLSRVQSPVDLDYNQTAEQRLRSTKLGAGQTAAFDLGSVFDYSADLDGRITDNTIPLLALSNLPPVPAAGSLRPG